MRPRVSGYLVSVGFRDGDYVRKGQRLFTIDARPYQAILDQAKGQEVRARATLQNATAQAAVECRISCLGQRRDGKGSAGASGVASASSSGIDTTDNGCGADSSIGNGAVSLSEGCREASFQPANRARAKTSNTAPARRQP